MFNKYVPYNVPCTFWRVFVTLPHTTVDLLTAVDL